MDGMYRISGKSNEVLRIKKDFDNGEILYGMFVNDLCLQTLHVFNKPGDVISTPHIFKLAKVSVVNRDSL